MALIIIDRSSVSSCIRLKFATKSTGTTGTITNSVQTKAITKKCKKNEKPLTMKEYKIAAAKAHRQGRLLKYCGNSSQQQNI